PQHELSSSSLLPAITEPLPTVIPFDNALLKQYTRRTRIAQSSVLPPVADEPASPLRDDSQGKACPTNFGFEADQDRANITKTSTLPSDSTPTVTSLAADEGSMQHKLNELMDLSTSLQRQQLDMASKIVAQDHEISQLKTRVKLLEDRKGGGITQSGEDAPIKERSLDEWEASAIKKDGGVQVSISPAAEFATATVSIPTDSGSIPTTSPPGTGVPTEEEMARDAQRMNEQIARVAEIARIHAEEGLQMMIDGLDKNNETVAKYVQEYHQFAAELPIGRRIELISILVKYQDNYAKVLKFQTKQRKPLSRKQHRDFYMSVLRSHADWKAKHFKGMTLEEIKEKFDLVWKQMQDFIPMSSHKAELGLDNDKYLY
nr:hypothetical protein [Tanacetum cinerariifolium]